MRRPLLSRVAERLLWRALRHARRRSQALPRAAGIHRYSVCQGAIRLAGTIAAPIAAPVQHLHLHLPGGETLPVPVSREAGGARFDAVLHVAAPVTEAAHAWLVADLADGTQLLFGGLGDTADDPVHAVSLRFADLLRGRGDGAMLEVGARARSGIVRRDWAPAGWRYSGFDILPGPNVDVVGDAHALSRCYEPDSFDAVVAFSVLEHLLMPWKFAVELNRVLKVGAVGMFVTHQCWPLHDQPWDFWRFSDTAWTGLLNPATGFKIIETCLGEPAFVVPRRVHAITAFEEAATGALVSAVLFRKTGPTSLDWPVELGDILKTGYPGGEVAV